MQEVDVVKAAKIFATRAHDGQTRKWTGDPYIVHPEHVVFLLESPLFPKELVPKEALAAAWLHDTVEDTDVTLEDVTDAFGDRVSALVFWLTDTTTLEDGNRATRKNIARDRLAKAPVEAQCVKVADIIANAASIAEHDRNFWKVFRNEVAQDIEAMDKVPTEIREVALDMLHFYDWLWEVKH
jgi:(p)ppGpp synthase/HD superfamily hydrolase